MALPDANKCDFHKNRKMCVVAHCSNQVYARGRCVRHGGKKKCQVPTCESYARGGDFCSEHGGASPKRYCSVAGCQKQAHARKKCVRHGGGRLCKLPGCHQHARLAGFCHRHNESMMPSSSSSNDDDDHDEVLEAPLSVAEMDEILASDPTMLSFLNEWMAGSSIELAHRIKMEIEPTQIKLEPEAPTSPMEVEMFDWQLDANLWRGLETMFS
ncbi:hypothetical protein SPRG_19301 [Saprolegnia parasitica CBS 223.65]|uniref:WRKY19-like zinc finger domain-containing protein n=1 Tax=Saprolegnia parasitica (strain CBS 223.65) TaxID=695850 RepID=A0A067CSP4_SAPPC|nr:hypothetical protein SPRG_19301 [Saprolegnia parasitica CBS 223.65]KDO33689.1 hypothetical protein SPRG_19301 [Saprolegnia parasitica CBS 223.65]|eukprot:XP_012195713.1 hypothetical protein SPRG_19301 [Saprolegnia parasitica CBS 223.65]